MVNTATIATSVKNVNLAAYNKWYSYPLCTRSEVAGDVVSGVTIDGADVVILYY